MLLQTNDRAGLHRRVSVGNVGSIRIAVSVGVGARGMCWGRDHRDALRSVVTVKAMGFFLLDRLLVSPLYNMCDKFSPVFTSRLYVYVFAYTVLGSHNHSIDSQKDRLCFFR